PNNPNREIDNVQTAARSLGQQILVLNANSDREFDAAFAAIAQQQVAALLVASDPLFFDRRDQLVALAARHTRRREFITLLGGAAASWPLAASAQQPAMPVIGVLSTRTAGADPRVVTAFHGGLKEAGFIEGQNLRIEYRFAANQYDRLPMLAADLVRQGVALITTMGTP